eukprot:c11483_g1_i1.p1 GENE.c11483_g1_i1~~c11483_g1_i1.p1  ORF type:complete len:249 (+),score=33.40 c11483_g1_i1:523-1269(+)
MKKAVAKLNARIDDVTVPVVENLDTNMLVLTTVRDVKLGEGVGVGGHIFGTGAFMLGQIMESRIHGAFNMIGVTASRNAEFSIDGVIKYEFFSTLKTEIQARGRVRVLDRSGPLSIRISTRSLFAEGHLGLEDVRLYLSVQERFSDDGKATYFIDLRVGSGEVSYASKYQRTGSSISTCWWGPGNRVSIANINWLLKAFTDDTLVLPPFSSSGVLDMVQVVGTLEELVAGKGRVRFTTKMKCVWKSTL